jgi:hypothetical protein
MTAVRVMGMLVGVMPISETVTGAEHEGEDLFDGLVEEGGVVDGGEERTGCRRVGG